MRELHGVVRFECSEEQLKRQEMIFDKFHVVHMGQWFGPPTDAKRTAEWEFLESRGLTEKVPDNFQDETNMAELFSFSGYRSDGDVLDSYVRYAASKYSESDRDIVPICKYPLPSDPDPAPEMLASLQRARPGFGTMEPSKKRSIELVLDVAVDALPSPDANCAWDDVMAFKAEMHDKQWAFRRFMKTLATKRQTEAEIRDDLEWSLNEYTKAMALHKIKASQSFVDVFVITPLEILENLVKFNWSKIAKSALQVRKRKVELMEAEMKAPGRECAYVFEARKRFGG